MLNVEKADIRLMDIRLYSYRLSSLKDRIHTFYYLLKVIVFGLVDISKVIVYVPFSGTVKFLPF